MVVPISFACCNSDSVTACRFVINAKKTKICKTSRVEALDTVVSVVLAIQRASLNGLVATKKAAARLLTNITPKKLASIQMSALSALLIR